jgi:outer membrane lipoprotein-sorting protein
MKSISAVARKRASAAFIALLLLTLVVSAASCKRREVAGNANDNAASASSKTSETNTTPPFSTKEPERYQARMVMKGSLGEGSNIPGMSELATTEMLITRDGERRRVDTEIFRGLKVTYLQTPSGRYVLVPAKQIYTEFNLNGAGGADASAKGMTPDFSPDKLLNQTMGGASYEKLGAEEVGGRATQKYRVTTTGKTGDAKAVTTESLIWIDEALGMPVKSESTSAGGPHNGAKYSMELRDIKLDIDQSLFELPPGYKKVDDKEFSRQIADFTYDSMKGKDKP